MEIYLDLIYVRSSRRNWVAQFTVSQLRLQSDMSVLNICKSIVMQFSPL